MIFYSEGLFVSPTKLVQVQLVTSQSMLLPWWQQALRWVSEVGVVVVLLYCDWFIVLFTQIRYKKQTKNKTLKKFLF